MDSTKEAIKTILKQNQPEVSLNFKKVNSDYYETKKASHKNGHSIFQKQSSDVSVRSKLASSKITNQNKEKQVKKDLHINTSHQNGRHSMTSRAQKQKFKKAKRESIHSFYTECG